MPAPPGSEADQESVAGRSAVVEADASSTPLRSDSFGPVATGLERSMRSCAALTWLSGPQLRTASTTASALIPSVTVPALQPVSVTFQLAPAPTGVPMTHPVAVPDRAKSVERSPA